MLNNSAKLQPPNDFNFDEIVSKQNIFSKNISAENLRHILIQRALFEAQLLHEMAKYPFDLLALAGFMRLLTPYFIDRVNIDSDNPKIMNIHPALLPAFHGTDGYGDTFYHGCKVGGCTVHFVDYDEDTGPIIGQKSFSIYSSDTIESIQKRGLILEWELFPECIQLFSKNRLCVAIGKNGRKIVQILPKTT